MSPQDSSLQRTAWLALRARAASWAVLDEDALLADGSFVRPLGMGAGSAIRPSQSDSEVVCIALKASPCCPWELEGSMALNLVGGVASMWSIYFSYRLQCGRFTNPTVRKIPMRKRCKKESPPGSAEEMGWVPFLVGCFFSRSQWILDFSTLHYCMSQCGCPKPNPAHGRWWVGRALVS